MPDNPPVSIRILRVPMLHSNLVQLTRRWALVRAAVPLAALSLSAIVLAGCGASADTADAPADAASSPGAGAQAAAPISDFRVRSELVFLTRADLSFELAGEVGSVNVSVGDHVSAGNILATLDPDTVTNLQHNEALAKFKIEQTQDELDRLLGLESEDPLIRARAENALAKAEVALESAQDALEDYQLDHEVALSAAVQRVADTTAALDRAEDAVQDFADAHGEQFANALAARAQARTALDATEEAVQDFVPLHYESLSKLQSDISKIEIALDKSREELRDFDRDHADRLLEARQSLASSETRLDNAQDRLDDFYVKIVNEEFHHLTDGQNFDVVQLAALQAARDSAQRSVETWQQEIAELQLGPKEIDRTAIETLIGEFEANLANLNRRLTDALAGPDPEELDRLEANVLVAEERLNTAERNLAEVEQGVDQIELARLETAVNSAWVALDSAQVKLQRLEEGPDAATIAALNQAVATARETRDDLAAGPDAAAVALAQANIADALVGYADVQDDLRDTVIVAPFDGLVRLVTIEPGDAIRVDARVIQLVDPTDVAVQGLVETNYIERVAVGTKATVTLAALPGVTLNASVDSVSQDARTERGVISFPVHFSVVIPDDVQIPPNPGLVSTTITVGDAGAPPTRRDRRPEGAESPAGRPEGAPSGRPDGQQGGSGAPNRGQ